MMRWREFGRGSRGGTAWRSWDGGDDLRMGRLICRETRFGWLGNGCDERLGLMVEYARLRGRHGRRRTVRACQELDENG